MKTELNKVGFLTILMLLGVLHVNAINVQRVLQGDTLNNKVDSTVRTMYIIEGDCSLSGDVSLAPGSILKFEGGMINGPGTIKSLCLIIDAPKYQIFKENVSVSGIANGEVSVHWWGAKGYSDSVSYSDPDLEFDNAIAINRALKAAGTSWVVLDNLKYKIKAPITLNKEGQKLKCYGNISYNPSNPDSSCAAIDLRASNIKLDINKLSGPDNGSGVLFSWNVFHGNINVNEIEKFKYGLNYTPVANIKVGANAYAGVQYCKISWQTIKCNTGIYIDLWSDQNLDSCTVWVNENQFNGGRLLCVNGIVVAEKKNSLNSYTADLINGNVFNCIGFEGSSSSLITPIILRHAWYNTFYDLRMSESLNNDVNVPLIKMTGCGYNTISIKSSIPYSRIEAQNCNNIELQGSFTDTGIGFHKGYDRLYVISSNPKYQPPLKTTAKDSIVDSYVFISSRMQSRNLMKSLYLGKLDSLDVGYKTRTINFNDLFVEPYDTTEKKVYSLSKVVEIGVYDNSTLTIELGNSIVESFPELDMRCNIGGGGCIVFNKNEVGVDTIQAKGNYRISYDDARNLKIVKMTD